MILVHFDEKQIAFEEQRKKAILGKQIMDRHRVFSALGLAMRWIKGACVLSFFMQSS